MPIEKPTVSLIADPSQPLPPVAKTAVRDENGQIVEIEHPPGQPPRLTADGNGGFIIESAPTAESRFNEVGKFMDLRAAGLGVSKTTFTDTFRMGPFTFRLRPVSKVIRLADDAFLDHAVAELGLEELAAQHVDFSTMPNPDEARKNAAIALFASETFRYGHPDLSTRADELIAERFEQVILGTDPDGSDPDKWGGLVSWQVSGIPADALPFTPDNVRSLYLQTKKALYMRIMAVSRAGDGDAGFRSEGGGPTGPR